MIFHVYNEDKSVKKGTLWMHNIDSTAPSCLIIGAFDHLSGNVHTSVGCGGGLWRLWKVVEGCGGLWRVVEGRHRNSVSTQISS